MTTEFENYKENDILGSESLIEYCLDLPLSFAIWKNQGDFVLISSKMQSLLKFQSLIIPSIEFVKGVSAVFGDFLYNAVEKVSEAQFANRKYSTNFSTKYNKNYCITLRYNIRSNVYIFTVVDSNTQQSNSLVEVYTKKTALLEEKVKIFSELLDNLPAYVWQKSKNAKMLYCNKEYATALGTTASDVISNNKHLFKTQNCFSQKNDCYQSDMNLKINGCDKNIKLTEFVSATNSNYILGIANEYIDIQNINATCEGYKNYLSYVSEYVPDGVVLFGKNNETIIFNKNAMSLLELTSSDVAGKNFFEIIDLVFSKEIFANSTKDYRNKLLNVIKNANNDVTVKFVPLCSGKTIRVSIVVNNNGMLLLLIKDVTDNLTLEREIKLARSVYQTILNNINDGIIILGTDNRVRFANSIVYGILNQSVSSLNEWHIKDCFDKVECNEAEAFVENLLNFTEMRTPKSEIVTFSNKTFESIYVPLPDGLNLLRFKDLSDFKLLEKDLQNASEKVAQINELKNNLITIIAEEYTVPLNTVIDLVEILSNKYFGELNDKQTEYCQSIIKTVGRLKDVADTIANIALILTDKINFVFEETDINTFIQSIVDHFSKVDPEHLITFEPAPSSFNVYIDVNFIKKAIYNIIISLISRNEHKHDIEIKVYKMPKNDAFFGIEIIDKENDISAKEIETYNSLFSKDFCLSDLKTVEIGYTLANLICTKHNGYLRISAGENNATKLEIQLQVQRFLS